MVTVVLGTPMPWPWAWIRSVRMLSQVPASQVWMRMETKLLWLFPNNIPMPSYAYANQLLVQYSKKLEWHIVPYSGI